MDLQSETSYYYSGYTKHILIIHIYYNTLWIHINKLFSDSGLQKNRLFTIQQLVHEDKVVLDVFQPDLAKLGCHDVTHLVEDLKHHGAVDIVFDDDSQQEVGHRKTCPGNVGDRVTAAQRGRGGLLSQIWQLLVRRGMGLSTINSSSLMKIQTGKMNFTTYHPIRTIHLMRRKAEKNKRNNNNNLKNKL